MEQIVRTRLKIINDSVESLITSARDAISKLKENTIASDEARVVACKLKAANERFVSEMYNYFKLVTEPSADEMSTYTSIQMQADELIAEIESRSRLSNEPKRNNQTFPPQESLHVAGRLPQMELAKFDGDVLKWHQFWDQFTSNVDSRNINDVDKLLYLQSVLSSEAKQAIEGLDTTNKNYKIAVETLKERYGKPAAIIDAHYVALYRIQTAGNTAKECRNVLNEIERHLRVLKSLGEDVNHNHLRVMIMEKFPEDLIYELRMKLDKDDESIETIRKNLEHIISARETSNRLKRDIVKGNTGEQKFTLDTLHVRSDSSGSRHGFRAKQQNFRHERKRNFDTKAENRFSQRKRPFEGKSNQNNRANNKRSKISCVFCHMDHFNDECTNFKSINERKQKLKGRCYNCLGENHSANDCRFKRKCRHCGIFGQHNRALCPSKVGDQDATKMLYTNEDSAITVLQTCTVQVHDTEDSSRCAVGRVLLDCGSQRSYITAEMVKKLKLRTLEENRLSVFTFGAKTPLEVDSPIVKFNVVTKLQKTRIIYANVVPHITNNVLCPYGNIQNIQNIPDIDQMVLADDGSRGDSVDILLGNDYYYSFMSNQKVEVANDLYLVKSDFGWLWSGRCPFPQNNKNHLMSVLTYFQTSHDVENHFHEPDLPLRNDNLKRLWDLESIGIVDSPKSSREDEAIKHYNETTQYHDNRYFVKWPWTEYPPKRLSINFGLALGRLTTLMKRLDFDTVKAYDAILQDQLLKGIIEIVGEPLQARDHPVHYLPLHGVSAEGKSLRIVYDGSSKIKDSYSLNECLYRGPLMLEDLIGLIIRFREHAVGIVADVEKAFLQIGLQQEDRDATRFLWVKDVNREVTSDNLQHFRFCRVPFGVISSPFLLNATVKHHLNQTDNEIKKQVAEDIYVDNLVTGTQTVQEGLAIYETAKNSFKDISMNLRDWNSNSKEFKARIPQHDVDKRSDTIKILGIEWDLLSDELQVSTSYNTFAKDACTKRGILKVTASIYDPCGFVAPMVLPAKLLLQDLWKHKLKWDETLSDEFIGRWKVVLSMLQCIEEISVPRLYAGRDKEYKSIEMKYELHCFSDASMQAYGAVVYLRAYNESEDKGYVSFVLGKSRLAPIKDKKDLQIPRLELLGAVIGCRLINYVTKFLRLPIQARYLWVDSEIVLNWHNSEKLLPPFISNRINEIKRNRDLIMRYVPTRNNPADSATRPTDSLLGNKYWLAGPDFLALNSDKWPKNFRQTSSQQHTHAQTSSIGEGLLDRNTSIGRRDEYEKVQNNTAGENNRDRNEAMEVDVDGEKERTYDSNEHVETILKLQKEHFPKEVQGIKTDLSRSLSLFKDEQGLLRCGGRFQNTDWTDDKKYPILLPSNTEFTTQIIETAHKDNYHVGVGHTLSIIRNRYWIVKGRSQVQRILKKCFSCRKEGGGPYQLPMMPPLPKERVRYSAPFTFTGLDYFGPLTVTEGSLEKRWICLFTCLAVRAIHMEVVNDLSAEECVLAIRRFVAVRGMPQAIISDNATQFKLTSSVLTSDYCIRNKISWRFIPELAPWFGGFYERLIGIVKNCLKRTIEKHLLNHGQLCTVIKEIESVVNTRPLTTVGQENEHILTPADFLRVGGPLVTTISDIDFLENATITKDNLVMGWKRGQNILQDYVKMFSSNYLNSLRERNQAHKQTRTSVKRIPKINDVVQIKNDNNRALWKVGRITEVRLSSDGQIRVAKVTMPSGETLTRSIGHLYPLELENEESMQSQISDQTSQPEVANNDTTPILDLINSQVPPVVSTGTDQLDADFHGRKKSDEVMTPEDFGNNSASRPKRSAAQNAREKIKKWTQQLISLIL